QGKVHREIVVLVEMMIHFGNKLLLTVMNRRRRHEGSGSGEVCSHICGGIQVKNIQARGVPLGRGDRSQCRSFLHFRWHSCLPGRRLSAMQHLVCHEEKRLIFLDRTTKSTAKLAAVKAWNVPAAPRNRSRCTCGLVEVIFCVEVSVTEKLKCIAM